MATAPPWHGGVPPVFVLLDDCQATPERPSSRLYTDFAHAHVCTDPATLEAVCQLVDSDLGQGLHAVLLIDYEWGSRLLHAGTPGGALRILLFRQCRRLSADAVQAWLQAQDGATQPTPGGVAALQASVEEAEFDQALEQIQTLLRSGASYQINYTYRLLGTQYGSVLGLYRRLRATQPVPFGALAHLPPEPASGSPEWILSRSPELLVQHQQGQLLTRPMKGTAARSSDPVQDQAQADWLAQDPKNRAENVMIVDLLRNDLGRIAVTGSVQVPQRFQVESYATVHQMTSSISATLRPEMRLPEVLRAVFPCGSITGAPKLQSMRHIAELERSPRGLYCGAIGWLDAPAVATATATATAATPTPTRLGDFCLSVAIRTLTLGPCQQGSRAATLGVGSGIVLDSDSAQEFQETRLKARFLTALDPGLGLIETLRWQGGRLLRLPAHLQRLQHSAQTLGWPCDAQAVENALLRYCQALDPAQTLRLRLELRHQGQLQLGHAPLLPLPPGPVALVLARQPLPDIEQALRQHKTTLRSSYDAAIAAAGALQAFDAIFVNTAGQVTEGARSNVLARINGRWCTPALNAGVLPGVLRSQLLQRWPALEVRVLTLQQLLQADQLAICNALRGLRRACWRRDAQGRPLEI